MGRRGTATAGARPPDALTLTGAGRRIHDEIERLTDALAYEPITQTLSDTEIHHLIRSLTAAAIEVSSSGVLPFPNPMALPSITAS